MKGLVTPEYSDIFRDDPTLEELLADIPSITLVPMLCWVNAQLHNAQQDIGTDVRIFNTLTARLPQWVRDQVVSRFIALSSRDSKSRFFVPIYITYFLHYELTNYREGEQLLDTTPEQEFNILRAYLLIVSKYYERNSLLPEVNREDRHFFLKRTWPYLTIQYEFNRYVDPLLEILKLHLLFDTLEKGEDAEFVRHYCSLMNCADSGALVLRLSEVMKRSFVMGTDGIRQFHVPVAEDYFSLMDQLSHSVARSENWAPASLLSMRAKPMYKLATGRYCVLNWDFYYHMVYEGIVHDFYERSGIMARYPDWPSFKSIIAHKVIERRLFRAVMKLIFNSKHEVCRFDEEDGNPDCYARAGKNLFILEMKDTVVRDELVTTFEYDELIKDIERKFIGSDSGNKSKPKAVRQLIKYTERFYRSEFVFDVMKGLKAENVDVHPVIVYSGYHYSMPGVNEYINEIYERERTHDTVALTMISIDYLFLYAVHLRKHGFRNAIRHFHKHRREYVRRFQKNGGMTTALSAFSPFEEVNRQIGVKSYKADPKFQRDFFQAAGLPIP